MLTRMTVQGAAVIKTGVCKISPPLRILDGHNELLAFLMFPGIFLEVVAYLLTTTLPLAFYPN